jgi:hypothetical protein
VTYIVESSIEETAAERPRTQKSANKPKKWTASRAIFFSQTI